LFTVENDGMKMLSGKQDRKENVNKRNEDRKKQIVDFLCSIFVLQTSNIIDDHMEQIDSAFHPSGASKMRTSFG